LIRQLEQRASGRSNTMKAKKSDGVSDSDLQVERENVVPRRTFLKSTVGGIAAGTLAASGLANTALARDWDSDHGKDWNKGRRILLKGGTILSMDPTIGDFLKGDILIDGTKISKVDKSISSHGATVVDASGTILIPGFVDSHRHAWQNFFRRAIPHAPLRLTTRRSRTRASLRSAVRRTTTRAT
jgi:hypothetical protein